MQINISGNSDQAKHLVQIISSGNSDQAKQLVQINSSGNSDQAKQLVQIISSKSIPFEFMFIALSCLQFSPLITALLLLL